MQVCSLGREDPPEEGLATHSIIPAWGIPWTEELGWLQSIGWRRVRHNWSDSAHTQTQGQQEVAPRPLGVTRFVAPPPLPASGSLNRPCAPEAGAGLWRKTINREVQVKGWSVTSGEKTGVRSVPGLPGLVGQVFVGCAFLHWKLQREY